MPPARRKSTQPSTASSRAQQKPISFGPSSKVTKPSTAYTKSAKSSKKDSPLQETFVKEINVIRTPEPEDHKEDGDATATALEDNPKSPGTQQRELAIRKQAQSYPQHPAPKSASTLEVQKHDAADPTEELARKVSDAAVKKYWRGIEEQRRAPRVHQQTLSLPEKILRHFDLSSQYGPCIGIPRLRRWKRAEKLGLKPPMEVLSVLLKEMDQGGEKEKVHVQRAYVDELMANRWEMEP